jgi:hypothetical protein
MAKAKTAAAPKTEVSTKADVVGYIEPGTSGVVKHNPPIEGDKALIEKTKAEAAAKVAAEKKAKADEKEAKLAAKKAEQAEKAEARAKSKAEREGRLAALAAEGKSYTGSMLALADRVKQGVYVVGATGQLRSNDELAQALDGVSATDVVRIGMDVLKLEDNPYYKLNVGQQSMNLRNRMRGAIKKNTLTIAEIKAYIERNSITVTPYVDPAVKAAAKAQKKADAEAAKAEKEKVAAAKAAKKEPESADAIPA